MNWDKEIRLKIDLRSLSIMIITSLVLIIYFFSTERKLDLMEEKINFLHYQYGNYSHLENRVLILEEKCKE